MHGLATLSPTVLQKKLAGHGNCADIPVIGQ
jgi:hypothetical protein